MWREENAQLEKEFTFADFASALKFVNKVGELAEAAQHHPDIQLSWGKVGITLSTHDEGKVTDKDRNLAKQIDKAFEAK